MELPHHNKPPPDSDIAQLWNAVRARVSQLKHRSNTVCETMSTTTTNVEFCGEVLHGMPNDADIAEYLDVMMVEGRAQFAGSSKERVVKLAVDNRKNVSTYTLWTFVDQLLQYREEHDGVLKVEN